MPIQKRSALFLTAALLAAAPSAGAQIRGAGNFGNNWNQGANNAFGRGGLGGLGSIGRRGFLPRMSQPSINYSTYYGQLSGRRVAPLVVGSDIMSRLMAPDTTIDPLLEELGIDDRPKRPKRRSDIDPSLRRWPTWVDVGGPASRVESLRNTEGGERPQASECYFVRMSDRVELRPAGEKGFFPLEFWDTSRRLGIGSRVRLSGRGRAVMIFSDGTQIEMVGEGEVAFVQGTIDRLVLEIKRCTHSFVRLGVRGVEIRLPDRSVVRGRRGSFELRRLTHDVGTVGGAERRLERLELINWGDDALRLQATEALRSGTESSIELPSRRRTLLMLVDSDEDGAPESRDDLPKTIPGGGLDMRAGVHATLRKDRRGLQVEARSGDAILRWGGTRMRVPVGTSLRIDPMQGDPFQERAK